MRKIIAPFSFLFILLLNSCNDSPMEPISASDFFPLSKGNKWFYRLYYIDENGMHFSHPDQLYDYSCEIIKDTTIGAFKYWKMKIQEVGMIDTVYLREDNNNFYWYWEDSNYKLWLGLQANFSLAQGDTFQFHWRESKYVALITEKTQSRIKIEYDIPDGYDDKFELTFIKSIGICEYYSSDWRNGRLLAKYEIN